MRGRLTIFAAALFLGMAVGLFACSPPPPAPPPQPQGTPTPDVTVQAVIQQIQQLERLLATAEPAMMATMAAQTPSAEPTAEPAATEEPAAAQPVVAAAAPPVFATRTPRPITAADAQPCQLGQIKGNRNSKIFHVPGGGSYAQTKANVICFETEAEAEAAGYRKARN